MADEWINVGRDFTVTCDIRLPDGSALLTLSDQTGHLVYYKRPDGRTGALATPTNITATSLVGTVPLALNPLTVSNGGKWKDGYPGSWEFYVYCVGSGGSVVFRSKPDILIVHPQWRTPQ